MHHLLKSLCRYIDKIIRSNETSVHRSLPPPFNLRFYKILRDRKSNSTETAYYRRPKAPKSVRRVLVNTRESVACMVARGGRASPAEGTSQSRRDPPGSGGAAGEEGGRKIERGRRAGDASLLNAKRYNGIAACDRRFRGLSIDGHIWPARAIGYDRLAG